jgi:hypothetical protein
LTPELPYAATAAKSTASDERLSWRRPSPRRGRPAQGGEQHRQRAVQLPLPVGPAVRAGPVEVGRQRRAELVETAGDRLVLLAQCRLQLVEGAWRVEGAGLAVAAGQEDRRVPQPSGEIVGSCASQTSRCATGSPHSASGSAPKLCSSPRNPCGQSGCSGCTTPL